VRRADVGAEINWTFEQRLRDNRHGVRRGRRCRFAPPQSVRSRE
jgi:hypothetical protein